MKENIKFLDGKQKLSRWKEIFESFIDDKSSNFPTSLLDYNESEIGSWFMASVQVNLPDNDTAKKLSFYIKKNLLIAKDIHDMKNKKDEYLPEYLIDEFFNSYNLIVKFMDELEKE